MITSSAIWILILAICPIILYSYLVYKLAPNKFISTHRARRYLVLGLLSPMLVFLIYFIFPDWGEPKHTNAILSLILYAFIQVGMLEETIKYTSFWWVGKERISEKYDLPIATMFYSMMTAVGFAITENIAYLIQAQNNCAEIHEMIRLIEMRSLTAVIAHMICGVIMGYFLAKSRQVTDTIFLKNKINKIKYIFMGIFWASLFHGVYDYNYMLPMHNYSWTFSIIILIFGLIIGKFIINKLIKQSVELRTYKN